MTKLRIIVGGYIGLYPTGGATIDYLQYPLGLLLLGHDVYYIEDTMQYPVFQKQGDAWDDASFCVNYLKETMEAYGFRDRWAYRDVASGNCFGMSSEKLKQVCLSADLFINISCSTFLRDEYLKIPQRILIDSDPMFTQIQYAKELERNTDARHWSTRQMIENHNYLFSFGENIEAADCLIPRFGFKWLPTRQPVCLDLWNHGNDHTNCSTFSSVMNWSGRTKLEYADQYWGQKDVEFQKFKDLPAMLPSNRFEMVVNRPLNKDCVVDFSEFRKLGWTILDPRNTVSTPAGYMDFINRSLAEFSVAKETYVKSRSGWFSCRSACYLAAGKPVVTQETQWSKYIPSGEGLFAFSDMETAVDAIRSINDNPAFHSAKAKALAHEYFDSRQVLTNMLQLLN
jgi:hypothetical protein